MKYPRAAIVIGLLLFMLLDHADAGNFYVRVSGDDENAGTAASAAFATIDQAALVADNGDTIYVGAGTYSDPVYVLGKKGVSALRIIADINGGHTGDSGTVKILGTPVRVTGSNNVQLKDFTFEGLSVYPVIWENSFDGLVEDCNFVGGTQAVMMKDGSLTLDGCQLDDFQNDAIQIDGAARLTVRDCSISDSLRHAILVRKSAIALIDGTTISGSAGDGIRVNVTADSILLDSIPTPDCDCEGTSPLELRQQAHGILSNLTLADPVYQQIIDSAESKLLSSMASSLWTDGWHANIPTASTLFTNTTEAVEEIFAVLTEDVDFIIENGQIVVSHPFIADVQVIGAAIMNGTENVPVTVKVKVGSTEYGPWGSFDSPTQANINDSNNPRTFESPDEFDPSEVITVAGRSWLKVDSSYSGDQDSHWYNYMTVDSNSNSPNVLVLRDGDPIPNIAGYNGQASAETFLQPYINENDIIVLEDNQAIFLFELGTTNLSSSAADFQDLVVIVTMARPVTPLTDAEKALLQQALDLITESTQRLTDCAIDEATVVGGNASDLQTAEQHFADGETHMAADDYVDAVTSWQDGWVSAKEATGNTEPDIPGVMAQLTAADPPSSWTAVSATMVEIEDSSLTGNENGVYAETAAAFDAENSHFSSNRTWGLSLRGTCSLDHVTLETNQYGGVMLSQFGSSDLNAADVTVSNNDTYALFLSNCDLTLSGSDLSDWSIAGSQYVLAGQGGTLTLDDVSVTGGSTAGVYFYQGILNVDNSTLSGNGYGIAADETALTVAQTTLQQNSVGLYTNNNAAISISNSTISDNSTTGISINSPDAPTTLTSCQVFGNDSGLSMSDGTSGDLVLVQTVVRDNTQHGLYFENCTLTLADQSSNNWQTLRNGSGITANGGTVTLNGVTIEDSGNFGIYATNSNLTLTNCSVSGANGIHLASDNQAFTATSSSILGSSASNSWGVTQLGGSATVTNCVVNGFENGLKLAGGVSSVLNNTLVNNSNYGIYVDGANANVKNTIVSSASGSQAFSRASGQLTHSHNLIHGFTTPFYGTTAHDTELLKQPRFVDAANDDYHLAIGSPAINSGTDLSGQVASDMDGNTRPSYGAFEIGAFEYVNSQGSFRVLDWQERE